MTKHIAMKTTNQFVIVDDDADDRYTMIQAFMQHGVSGSRFFEDGRLFLEWLNLIRADSSSHPDFILLDYYMPSMSGECILKALKSDPVFASIPVLVYSSQMTGDKKTRLLEIGASGCLRKPFKDSEAITIAGDILYFINPKRLPNTVSAAS